MEEVMYEMTYTINGDKYVVTATKVNDEPKTACCTDEVACGCDCEPIDLAAADEIPSSEGFGFNNDKVTFVSLRDIPDGMTIEEWLSIVDRVGIVLVK